MFQGFFQSVRVISSSRISCNRWSRRSWSAAAPPSLLCICVRFTVLSGELILNFRKVRNPRTLAITSVGFDAVNLIKDSAELSIVQRGGASTDQVYSDLIPKLLEHGLLGEVSSRIGNLTPILSQEFVYHTDDKTWHVKPGKKLGCHIPLEHRIRF